MNKLLITIFSLANVVLGVLYGFSDGPYVEIERSVVPASELASSGSDDGFLITLALLTFSISALVAVASITNRIKPNALTVTYIVNYLIYVFFIYLVQLDTSLTDSIKFGDWPLLLGLVVPTALFAVVVLMLARLGQLGAQ